MKILIIGGNRFFGRKLVFKLHEQGHDITLLNRGNNNQGFPQNVQFLQADRNDTNRLKELFKDKSWDLVYDQVCYEFEQAKSICEVLKNKTKKLIFTSSKSVYEDGADLEESKFNNRTYKFTEYAKKDENYAEAKRQTEVAFEQFATFELIHARFPIVIGHDDYTERFKFHVSRIKNGMPVFFPNLDAKISFINSDFAAETLAFLANSNHIGPINAASSKPISLRRFVEIIENKTSSKTNFAKSPTKENHSPYGIENDWFMNCKKLISLGLETPEIEQWLPSILD